MVYKVTVDSREPKKVIENGRKLFYIDINTLDEGDVQNEAKTAVIERKEVKDFLSSIRDRRLKEQPLNMQKFPFRWIIIEGDFDKLRKEDKRYRVYSDKMIAGKIASLEVKHKCSVLKVKNNREFWIQVERLFYQVENPEVAEYCKTYEPKITAKNKKDKVLSAICTVQGVSETKGLLIKNECKTILNLCKMTEEDLVKIPGIGPVIAKKIKEVF